MFHTAVHLGCLPFQFALQAGRANFTAQLRVLTELARSRDMPSLTRSTEDYLKTCARTRRATWRRISRTRFARTIPVRRRQPGSRSRWAFSEDFTAFVAATLRTNACGQGELASLGLECAVQARGQAPGFAGRD